MMHKAWCHVEEVPYNFSRSPIKFQGHTGWKIDNFNPIWVRLLGRSQLSNPLDLICLVFFFNPGTLSSCQISGISFRDEAAVDEVQLHYSDVIMSTMASQITSVSIVYSSGAGGGGGALPPIAIRGCAALLGRFWKAGFPQIGCDFIKFP